MTAEGLYGRIFELAPEKLQSWMASRKTQLVPVITAVLRGRKTQEGVPGIPTPSSLTKGWPSQPGRIPKPDNARPNGAELLPLDEYDFIVVAFSGGKDSIAAALHVRDLCRHAGARDPELWHHLIDGEPGSKPFMDWACTEDYCRAFADAAGFKLRYQWKVGGFWREMHRKDARTAPTRFETDDGVLERGGKGGKPATRMQFPQVAADLSVRWCSAYLKIDVGRMAIINDPRTQAAQKASKRGERGPAKILLVTGERREESPNRNRYSAVEIPTKLTQHRTVHQWRPILDWNEAAVWARVAQSGLRAHPCYDFGYGRASCATCIFGGPSEWHTAQEVIPTQFETIAMLEEQFNKTIHRKEGVRTRAAKGKLLLPEEQLPEAQRVLQSQRYALDIRPPRWKLPLGAFRHGAGPN